LDTGKPILSAGHPVHTSFIGRKPAVFHLCFGCMHAERLFSHQQHEYGGERDRGASITVPEGSVSSLIWQIIHTIRPFVWFQMAFGEFRREAVLWRKDIAHVHWRSLLPGVSTAFLRVSRRCRRSKGQFFVPNLGIEVNPGLSVFGEASRKHTQTQSTGALV
jgi:hypothetical protein